jgi:Holliday junction DNA helicase RuvB
MRKRPKFHDFVGQRKVLVPIRKLIEGAVALNKPMPHLLLTGQSGLGKSLLARALTDERGVEMVRVLGNVTHAELVEKLLQLQYADVLFIDECHALGRAEQELLFEALDNRRVPPPEAGTRRRASATPNPSGLGSAAANVTGQGGTGQVGATPPAPSDGPRKIKRFTLLGATDRPGLLLNPFRKRFLRRVALSPYGIDDMREIVATLAAAQQVLVSPQAARKVARASHGLPRAAVHHLDGLRLRFPGGGQLGVREVKEYFGEAGIDRDGLEELERRYLKTLRKRGGRASLGSLAAALGTDPDDVQYGMEPTLLYLNLIDIGSGGRVLTPRGEQRILGRQVKP